jgi:pimeloyl-ACP methyl ester carboxylesterase
VYHRVHELRKTPILFIMGDVGGVHDEASAEGLLKRVRYGELQWVKQAGHLVPFERPGDTADFAVPFIANSVRRWAEERKTDVSTPRTRTVTDEWMAMMLSPKHKL